MGPDVVAVERESGYAITRHACGGGVDTVRGAGFHVRNYGDTRPHFVSHAIECLEHIRPRYDGSRSRFVRRTVGHTAAVIDVAYCHRWIADHADELLADLLGSVARQDTAID